MIIRPKHGFPRFCVMALVCICALSVAASGTFAYANDTGDVGSGKRQYRNEALQAIPYHQLNQATKEKISDILQKPSIYRRLPVTSINADPDYFRFLVRYPEVIVNIWQLMGITRMTTERTGPFTFVTNDGAGTISSLELLYGSENLHIFYGTGTYEGPVLRKKLTGQCVLILQTKFLQANDGKPQAVNQLDVFLKVDNATLGLIARSIQPIVGTTADHNFVESLKFVQRLNSTTEKNGPGVQGMAQRLEVDREVKAKFVDLAGVVYERAGNSHLKQPVFRQPLAPIPRQPGARRLGEQAPYQPPSSQPNLAVPYQERQVIMPQSGVNQIPSNIGQVRYDHWPGYQSNHGNANRQIPVAHPFAARPYGYQAPQYHQAHRGAEPPIIYSTGGSHAIQYAPPAGQSLRR